MKKFMLFLMFLLSLTASAVEYEFLTPQVVVLKTSAAVPFNHSSVGMNIIREGFWAKENGLKRDAKGNILKKADITGFTYLVFGTPFQKGEKRNLYTIVLQYDPEIPSNIFKLNQVGNGINQQKKYAYIGAWLGSAGALALGKFDGREFEVRKSSNDQCVFRNKLKLRCKDHYYTEETSFTGEEVLELDYSSFNIPGKYYFYVDGIGRSMDFVIGPETLSEAFYIHARGLYHKRCGIAKTQPFTAWESPACHQNVEQSRFPGNAEHYRKGKAEKDFGFFDIKDNRIEVRHFDLIKANMPYKKEVIHVRGGWHDAADYDRRPYHLRIVSDLATVYLMKSENFIDGQLNIPESGNGIPDILDEAAWGVKHLLAVQRKDGGTGTWFETFEHPQPGEGLPDEDKRTYYISCPSRNGTLEYAAVVSTLALAMKKAGADAESEKYFASAVKAWDFAMEPRNRSVAWFNVKNRMISYREEPYLNAENLLKAAVNLYILADDEKYLLPIKNEEERIFETFNRNFWRWSVLSWMTLAIYDVDGLEKLKNEYCKVVLHNADQMLADLENAYSYRILWHAHNAPWVHAMAWGNYHPLRRAVTLIAAHKLSGEQKYLDGAYLANDFHNGANPLGRSMTSGLGKIYPAVFLDLVSYADKQGEFVPGITPYGNTFGLDRNAVKMLYGENADKLPIFRRYVNLEFLSVPSSEYSVWETIAPAAVTTGYLIENPLLPSDDLKNRKPAADFRKLPGYRALP